MFRRKLYTYFFILITAALIISGVVIARISTDRYKKQVEIELKTSAGAAVYFIDNSQISDYDLFADEFSKKLNSYVEKEQTLRVTIIRNDGVVLGDSVADISTMDNHRLRPEVITAEKNGIGMETRRSDTTDIDYMYLAVRASEGHIVRVSVALAYLNTITGSIYASTFIAILVSLLFAALIGYRISERFTEPIALLTEHSNEVSNGNLSHRIPYNPSNDELGRLSNAFNDTTAALESAFNEISDRINELSTLLNAINDGIIAVSSENNILFANKRINGFPGFELIKSGGNINLIKSSAVLELIEDTMKDEVSIQREIIRKDNIYSCFSSYFTLDEGKGVIISMQDVSRIKKLERLRYEFVSNVTHELNTPLTSIKGFIETLKEGAINDPATATQFLNIIEIESERLSNLINDILTLSSIENDTVISHKEDVEIRSVANDALLLLSRKINDKSISASNDIPSNIFISADPDRIKQLFINLIDNAVKYNKANGSVELYLKKNPSTLEIHVKDTGIGIDESHIERLFERFYRVDKGRSREMGGTGLGLSIVKHIALLYNGSVSVDSTPGEGSDFCISFPLD